MLNNPINLDKLISNRTNLESSKHSVLCSEYLYIYLFKNVKNKYCSLSKYEYGLVQNTTLNHIISH